jgi:hypothetical protein
MELQSDMVYGTRPPNAASPHKIAENIVAGRSGFDSPYPNKIFILFIWMFHSSV